MSYRFNPFTGNLDFDSSNVFTGPPPIEDLVPALSTKAIDTQAKAGFSALYYDNVFIGTGAVLNFRSAIFNEGGVISDQVFNRAGSLSMTYQIVEVGLNIEVQVVNPNAFDINVLYFRTII